MQVVYYNGFGGFIAFPYPKIVEYKARIARCYANSENFPANTQTIREEIILTVRPTDAINLPHLPCQSRMIRSAVHSFLGTKDGHTTDAELAMYEALYVEDVPMNVAIHEAVKLAQKYEEPETVAFVNGVLGAFSRDREPTP